MRSSLGELRPYVRRVAVLWQWAHWIPEVSPPSVIQSYLTDDHHKSHHQGLGHQRIAPAPGIGSHSGSVVW
jgi:hypothetical protein